MFVGCFGGGGGGGKSQSSSSNKEDTTTKVSCETTVTLGNKDLGDFKVDKGEILDYSTLCPAGSSAASATITCGSDGNFNAAAKCLPDYIETGVNCGGTLVDFDEYSMVLEVTSSAESDYKVLMPFSDWHYNTPEDESITDFADYSTGQIWNFEGTITDKYIDLFEDDGALKDKNQLDVHISWGDGDCTHINHSNYNTTKSELLHTYTTEGLKTIKVKGVAGGLHGSYFLNSTDVITDQIELKKYFNKNVRKVKNVGSLAWFDLSFSFAYMMLSEFKVNFTDFSNLLNTAYMFYENCTPLIASSTEEYLDLIDGTNCMSLEIDFSNVDFKKLLYSTGMFDSGLFQNVSLEAQKFDSLLHAMDMFSDSTVLNEIKIANLYLPKIEKLDDFFDYFNYNVFDYFGDDTIISDSPNGVFDDEDKIELDISGWDFGTSEREISFQWFVENCSVKSIDFTGWTGLENSSGVYLQQFFDGTTFTEINLSFLKNVKIKNMNSMFLRMENIVHIDLSELNLNYLTDFINVFGNTSSLQTVNLGDWNASNINGSMRSLFSGSNLSDYTFLENWDVSKVTEMKYMFNDANVSMLDLSAWDTSSLQDATGMFNGFSSSQTLNLGYWESDSLVNHPNNLSVLGVNVYCHVEGDNTTAGTIETTAGTFNCIGPVAPDSP